MFSLEPVLFTLAPSVGAMFGSFVVMKNMKWYESLQKPWWRPPNWLFAPAFVTLFSEIGYASYLVYRDGGGFSGAARTPLMLFGAQLVMKYSFSLIMFGTHKLGMALFECCLATATATAAAVSFYSINPTAVALMVPYVLWLEWTAASCYSIWRNNPQVESKKD